MTPGSPTLCGDAAGSEVDGWALTSRISPRRMVRAATVDTDGRPLNSYPLIHPVTGARPWTPWAVHLADATGRFRLLCADLDAKGPAPAADADAARLSGLLADLGIEHLVCASGPTGGRHVWLGLHEPLDAVTVSALAYLLKAWLPALDVAPLLNPTSGCVRPPGAPHRLGGSSQVIAGSVTVLTDPTVTTEQVHALMVRLAEHTQTVTPTPLAARRRPVAEVDGLAFLPGPKRALSASCRALLEATPTGDLSAVLWRILCGAAAARWRYADLAALAEAPGLEHARTLRDGLTRRPRPTRGPASPAAVLRRQWTRAVHAVADLAPGLEGSDATFDTRAETVTAIVRTVQRRADATPGRWGRSRAGLAQRRILDALCLFHLQGVRIDEVEADIRRLALTCGLDRETARRSLLALAADGWIARTHPAAGRRGARWTIDPGGAIHTQVSGMLSQADPRPAGTGPALRTTLIHDLDDRLRASAHDAFARQGLGLDAGSLYGRLHEPLDTLQCARLQGWPLDKTSRILEHLSQVGLVEGAGRGWQRTGGDHLDRASVELGTHGVGQRRADRYALERALWEWWRAELDALRRAHPRLGLRLLPRACRQGLSWRQHPRSRDGRADFHSARQVLLGRPHAPRAGYSLRGTPGKVAQTAPTFEPLTPRQALNRTGPGLPGRATPRLTRTKTARGIFPWGVRPRPSSLLLVGEGEADAAEHERPPQGRGRGRAAATAGCVHRHPVARTVRVLDADIISDHDVDHAVAGRAGPRRRQTSRGQALGNG